MGNTSSSDALGGSLAPSELYKLTATEREMLEYYAPLFPDAPQGAVATAIVAYGRDDANLRAKLDAEASSSKKRNRTRASTAGRGGRGGNNFRGAAAGGRGNGGDEDEELVAPIVLLWRRLFPPDEEEGEGGRRLREREDGNVARGGVGEATATATAAAPRTTDDSSTTDTIVVAKKQMARLLKSGLLSRLILGRGSDNSNRSSSSSSRNTSRASAPSSSSARQEDLTDALAGEDEEGGWRITRQECEMSVDPTVASECVDQMKMLKAVDSSLADLQLLVRVITDRILFWPLLTEAAFRGELSLGGEDISLDDFSPPDMVVPLAETSDTLLGGDAATASTSTTFGREDGDGFNLAQLVNAGVEASYTELEDVCVRIRILDKLPPTQQKKENQKQSSLSTAEKKFYLALRFFKQDAAAPDAQIATGRPQSGKNEIATRGLHVYPTRTTTAVRHSLGPGYQPVGTRPPPPPPPPAPGAISGRGDETQTSTLSSSSSSSSSRPPPPPPLPPSSPTTWENENDVALRNLLRNFKQSPTRATVSAAAPGSHPDEDERPTLYSQITKRARGRPPPKAWLEETHTQIIAKLEAIQSSFRMSRNQQLRFYDRLFPLSHLNHKREVCIQTRNVVIGASALLNEKPTIDEIENRTSATQRGAGEVLGGGAAGAGGLLAPGAAAPAAARVHPTTVNPNARSRKAGGIDKRLQALMQASAMSAQQFAVDERTEIDYEKDGFATPEQQKQTLLWAKKEYPHVGLKHLRAVLAEYNFYLPKCVDILNQQQTRNELEDKKSIWNWMFGVNAAAVRGVDGLTPNELRAHQARMPKALLRLRQGQQAVADAEMAVALSKKWNHEEEEIAVLVNRPPPPPEEFRTPAGGGAESPDYANTSRSNSKNSSPATTSEDSNSNAQQVSEKGAGTTTAAETIMILKLVSKQPLLDDEGGAGAGSALSSSTRQSRAADPRMSGRDFLTPERPLHQRSLEMQPLAPTSSASVPRTIPGSGIVANASNRKTWVKIHHERNYLECECCFGDDFLPEECVACEEHGHVFCKQCVKTFIDNLCGGQYGSEITQKYADAQRLLCFSCSGADPCESFISRESLLLLATPAGSVDDLVCVEVSEQDEREWYRGVDGTTETHVATSASNSIASNKHLQKLEKWWLKRSLLKAKKNAAKFQDSGNGTGNKYRGAPAAEGDPRQPGAQQAEGAGAAAAAGRGDINTQERGAMKTASTVWKTNVVSIMVMAVLSILKCAVLELRICVNVLKVSHRRSQKSFEAYYGSGAAAPPPAASGSPEAETSISTSNGRSTAAADEPLEQLDLCPYCGHQAFPPASFASMVKAELSSFAGLVNLFVIVVVFGFVELKAADLSYGPKSSFFFGFAPLYHPRTLTALSHVAELLSFSQPPLSDYRHVPVSLVAELCGYRWLTSFAMAIGYVAVFRRAGPVVLLLGFVAVARVWQAAGVFGAFAVWWKFCYDMLWLGIYVWAELQALDFHYQYIFPCYYAFIVRWLLPQEIAKKLHFYTAKLKHDVRNRVPLIYVNDDVLAPHGWLVGGFDRVPCRTGDTKYRVYSNAYYGAQLETCLTDFFSYFYALLQHGFGANYYVEQVLGEIVERILGFQDEVWHQRAARRNYALWKMVSQACSVETSAAPVNLRCTNERCGVLYCKGCKNAAHYFPNFNYNTADLDEVNFANQERGNNVDPNRARGQRWARRIIPSKYYELQSTFEAAHRSCAIANGSDESGAGAGKNSPLDKLKIPVGKQSPSYESFVEYVSEQMSQKKVRNCVECGLQFGKGDGCNHMKCPDCGAHMCYVCKQQLFGPNYYDHFCTHFLPDPDQICSCDKCPAYKDYDSTLVKEAGEVAIKAFLRKFPHFRKEHAERFGGLPGGAPGGGRDQPGRPASVLAMAGGLTGKVVIHDYVFW
eukprot:CAMPEP_0178995934 /NCGR_PEP_ID=MMETSP0795-20121207/8089_1 /TAXON_ID=88552 /ORGANISM="Amoebophrya sp., Strain Ameob2" /LENGTH=1908 /DNA_ID=CAMNT_0020688269 /DNA_START=77 /DNA_END=5801 /DNA_ORIENTATION=+